MICSDNYKICLGIFKCKVKKPKRRNGIKGFYYAASCLDISGVGKVNQKVGDIPERNMAATLKAPGLKIPASLNVTAQAT